MISCLICGSSQRIEDHHVGRATNLAVTVPLCRQCHARQTGLQRRFGVFRLLPGDEQRLWSIAHGFMGLLIEHARALSAPALATDERAHRAILRLLASLTDDPIGPNPIANTFRGRPKRANRRKSVKPVAPPNTTAEPSPESFAVGFMPALAMAVAQIAPDSETLRVANHAADCAEQLTTALSTLENHPRAAELHAAMERTALGVEALAQCAASIAESGPQGKNGQPEERLIVTLRDFHSQTQAGLRFLTTLADGANPSSALAHFLDHTVKTA